MATGTVYSTEKKGMFSFDDIIAAMVAKHNINPLWGAARPGIILSAGARISNHEFEFLVGNAVGKFSLADVETAVAEHFDLTILPDVPLSGSLPAGAAVGSGRLASGVPSGANFGQPATTGIRGISGPATSTPGQINSPGMPANRPFTEYQRVTDQTPAGRTTASDLLLRNDNQGLNQPVVTTPVKTPPSPAEFREPVKPVVAAPKTPEPADPHPGITAAMKSNPQTPVLP
jgi:hypothetical protein